MKKFLVICGLAMALSALSHQRASAWHKFNFSVGLNVSWEAANNSYFCGGIVSGPGPGDPGPFGWPPAYAPAGAWGTPAPIYGGHGGYVAAPAVPAAPAPVAAPAAQPVAQGPVQQAHYTWGQPSYYPQNYYQPSNYGYGYSVPSYWYGY